MATPETAVLKDPPQVRGIPLIGNTLDMAKDPAKFFVDCYRQHGPVFRIKVMGNTYTVLAGAEAANFMGTRAGRDSLRSKEFWQGLVNEWGASKTLTGEDGETHNKLRAVMRHGYSKESVAGRYDELVAITDSVIDRDWPTGELVPVLQNMQYIVTEQLGAILTGTSPREYVSDIRTTILYILNILVTRQRPKFLLKDPRYRHAKERVSELGRRMIAEYYATRAERRPENRNLVDDIMEAHERDPDLIPANDLILSLTGPFVAGLDTVANTTAAFIYAVLKHPQVLERVTARSRCALCRRNHRTGGSAAYPVDRRGDHGGDAALPDRGRADAFGDARLRVSGSSHSRGRAAVRRDQRAALHGGVLSESGSIRHRPLREAARGALEARRVFTVRARTTYLPWQITRGGADGNLDGATIPSSRPRARARRLRARNQDAAHARPQHEVQGPRPRPAQRMIRLAALLAACAMVTSACTTVKIKGDDTSIIEHEAGAEVAKDLTTRACRRAGQQSAEIISTVNKDPALPPGTGKQVTTFRCSAATPQ